MKLATLIPAYKVGFVRQLIKSIVSQTIQPNLVLISDDSPEGIFEKAFTAYLSESGIKDLNIKFIQGPRTKSAYDNLKNLIINLSNESDSYDLVHIFLDDDVIFPTFYENHHKAHYSGDFSCSISARWIADEEGFPNREFPLPEFVANFPERSFYIEKEALFLSTLSKPGNWLGELSNTVIRKKFLSLLLDPSIADISYAGLWDLGGFLKLGIERPVCFINDHLGFFRRCDGEQNSGKIEYVKCAVIAFAALALASVKIGILNHNQILNCIERIEERLPLFQSDDENIAEMIATMPRLKGNEANSYDDFIRIWHKVLQKHNFLDRPI